MSLTRTGQQVFTRQSNPDTYSNLKDFEKILSEVDNAFRSRKEDSKRLEWEIADLENQLDDIERNTDEYAEIAASEGAALSWTKQTFAAMEEEWNTLCFTRSKEFSSVRNMFDDILVEGNCMADRILGTFQYWKQILVTVNSDLKCAKEDAIDFTVDLTALKEKDLELKDSLKELYEKSKIIDSNISLLDERLREMEMKNRHLQQRNAEMENELVRFQSEQNNARKMLVQLKEENYHLHDKVNIANESLQDMEMLLACNLRDTLLEKQMFSAELESMKKEIDVTRDIYCQTRVETALMTEKMDSLITNKRDIEKEIESYVLHRENLLFYFADLEGQKLRLRGNIQTLRSVLHHSLKDHEQRFQLSCMKLRELQDLQSQQSAALIRCNLAKQRLQEFKYQLHDEFLALEAENEKLLINKNELFANVENAEAENQIAEEQFAMQKEDIYSRAEFIQFTDHIIRQNISFQASAQDLQTKMTQKRLLLQNLDDEISNTSKLHVSVLAKLDAQENELIDILKSLDREPIFSISVDKVGPDSWTREEEEEIQNQVEAEIHKISRELQSRHDHEICALEECREKIKQALINSPNIVNLRKEISNLEKQLDNIQQCNNEAAVTAPIRISNTIPSYTQQLRQHKSNYPPQEMEKSTVLSSFLSKKRKFSTLARDTNSILSKVSMEDLFADDF